MRHKARVKTVRTDYTFKHYGPRIDVESSFPSIVAALDAATLYVEYGEMHGPRRITSLPLGSRYGADLTAMSYPVPFPQKMQ